MLSSINLFYSFPSVSFQAVLSQIGYYFQDRHLAY